MAKKPAKDTAHPAAPALFESRQRATERRLRRQRALFIPRYVEEAAKSPGLRGEAFDKAFEVARRWARMDRKGELLKHTERSIDAEFLAQLFGQGLGYASKTQGKPSWTLDREWHVQGVGTADGILGRFPADRAPTAVVELKRATVDLDRDVSNGRTAVQQAFDYLNAMPDCPWAIVSNFSTIRLYHRDKGSQAFEAFDLAELEDEAAFARFYAIFQRDGLLTSPAGQTPRALALLEKSRKRQEEVGDKLYDHYRRVRQDLIAHLVREHAKPLDNAIAIAQKLLDRVLFIAFCEDRQLLPDESLKRAHAEPPRFSRAQNPRWENFLALFDSVDRGNANITPEIAAFNGNLFKRDPELDELDLDDHPWTQALATFGTYDFSEEVNVEVLGHLFERSITELEKLRMGGLFAITEGRASEKPQKKAKAPPPPKMTASAERKRFGVYYTPEAFTGLIVQRTVDRIVAERFAAAAKAHGVDPAEPGKASDKKRLSFWTDALESLRTLTVCDPACGSGAFLIRAYDALEASYRTAIHGMAGAGLDEEAAVRLEDEVPDRILRDNIFGVDLSAEAVEITRLALWIRSARRGHTLADLSGNIIAGNSLVDDPAVHPEALNWKEAFPAIFAEDGPGGFTCVIGNPPWERVKVQEREFFALTDPVTASAVSAAERRKRIKAMPKDNPELHERYVQAKEDAKRVLDYARKGGRYPLSGRGDVNTYMLFVELASSIVAPDGVVGLLVPSGLATDKTTMHMFAWLVDGDHLAALFDFENKLYVFKDVDSRFKFSAVVFGGGKRTFGSAEFLFFGHRVEDALDPARHRVIELTRKDLAFFNPNTKTSPLFRTQRDKSITRHVYERVPILSDHARKTGGNPWGVKYFTMFHQTNDAEHFKTASQLDKLGYTLEGNVFSKKTRRALPLYEAKMVQAYDHRAASIVVAEDNWVRQGQKEQTTLVEHQNPEFAVLPRWWVLEDQVNKSLGGETRSTYLAFKDVTSSTNQRTMIAAFAPHAAFVNSIPLLLPDADLVPRRIACLLANLNSTVYDFVARQKVGGNHLNFFIVEQLPTLSPDAYDDPCPWERGQTLEAWISERVLKLSCTADDMKPLAEACGFEGSLGGGVHKWKDAERAELLAELDAAFAILYDVQANDLEYMLTTFQGMTDAQRAAVMLAYEGLRSHELLG
ncbi:MAG: hypothetical protein KIT54_09820 [Phycisphaeraceae bacterium]|nr:hypothetical protein [Phycisphaeraceae bacterium]